MAEPVTTSGDSWEGCQHCGHFIDWHVGHGDSRFRCHKCGCTIDRDMTLLSGGLPARTEKDDLT